MCSALSSKAGRTKAMTLIRRYALPVVVGLGLLCVVQIAYEAYSEPTLDKTVWTVSGRTILLDGVPFFVRGVNYSPTPVGGSFNWSPFGDWFTRPWREIHQRDMPRLREMNANSIRIHSWFAVEPWDDNYEKYAHEGFPKGKTKDHTDFLDLAWNGGKNPLFVLITIPLDKPRLFDANGDKVKTADSERVYAFYKRTTRWLTRKYGKHPAVMGFLIGNECNDAAERPAKPQFMEKMRELAKIAKSEAPDKLVATAWFPKAKEYFLRYPELLANTWSDFIGINMYNGPLTYAELWELYDKRIIPECGPKPVLITEFGTPACTESETTGKLIVTPESETGQDRWVMKWWNEIVERSVLKDPVKGITSGGYVFAWSDEWWKTEDRFGHAARRDPGYIPQEFLASEWLHDECFGINSIEPNPERPPLLPWDKAKEPGPYAPDTLTPRKVYYSLKKAWGKLEQETRGVARSR